MARFSGVFTLSAAFCLVSLGPTSSEHNDKSCYDQPTYIVTKAVAALSGPTSEVTATLTFDQPNGEGPVHITGTILNLGPPGVHGFHIHEIGDIADGCDKTGEQFLHDYSTLPITGRVGGPGDLGVVVPDSNGKVVVDVKNDGLSLNGDSTNILGRPVVVHGLSINGAPGARLACGIIGVSAQEENPAHNKVNS